MRRITRHILFVSFVAWCAARYLKFVYTTTKFIIEPSQYAVQIDKHVPVIFAMWHGQHFLVPFFRRPQDMIDVLISRHGDGEINARAIQNLGLGLIRGSGDYARSHRNIDHKKGGMIAFREMLRSINQGRCLALTADVPKRSCICGIGIVKLAAASQRPIVPIAVTTHARIKLRSWDKANIPLPFSLGACLVGDPIYVEKNCSEEALEAHRLNVEAVLNALNSRAVDIADKKLGIKVVAKSEVSS